MSKNVHARNTTEQDSADLFTDDDI